MKIRCKWVNIDNKKYIEYHDNEWGVQKNNDDEIFEALSLEIFQAGLSWETVLDKRDDLKTAFDNWDIKKISNYDKMKINQLLSNKKIICHSKKIEAIINNAKVFLQITNQWTTFSNYIWYFLDGKKNINKFNEKKYLQLIINNLKDHGMKFIGPIIIYNFLQTIGFISLHDQTCFKNK